MANMMVHQAEISPRQLVEVSRWSEWCLENTCSLLQHKFPGSAVWLVRPCRMLRRLFSAFHNFVESSMTGVPTYSTHHGALLHLHQLLADALAKVNRETPLKMSVDEALHLPLVLTGFSKGCVVLNQITYELVNTTLGTTHSGDHGNLEATPTPKTDTSSSVADSKLYASKPLPLDAAELSILKEVVSRIRAMYWLDSGHSGEVGAWVTEDEPLQSLSHLRIPVHVDVTPQQVRDPTREWIGLEEAEFVSKLRQLGTDVVETLHFEHEEKSLERHFMVLREFKPHE